MRVLRGLHAAAGRFRRPGVTIGNFDGLHLGHQFILRQLLCDARQRDVQAVVLTFDPHPVAVLRPDKAPRLLMTLGDRLRTMASIGPDACIVQRFSPTFAEIEAEDFIRRFLVDGLNVQKLLVGHDLNFGRGRRGSVESMVEAGSRYGFAVEVIRPVYAGDVLVHSSVVREVVAEGDVAAARELLGRPHRVRGRVVSGAGRGRGLGFATANLRPATQAVPPHGVYSTVAAIDGQVFDSVTSIGSAPTFGGQETVIEAHIFGDPGDLYGRALALDFIDHLREQRTFASKEELVAQISRDVDAAHESLARWRT
jgi:riboflavin kinase/FMN adenylyltransferase